MPDINGVQVTIVSNDKPLEEYEVTYEGDTATCWIPSEAGEVRTVTQILPLSVDRPRSSFGRGSSARWRSTDDTKWFQTFEIRWRVHPGLPLHNVHRVFDCYMDGRGMKRALGKPSHRSGSVLGVSTGATTLRPFTFSTVQLTGTSNFRPIRFFFRRQRPTVLQRKKTGYHRKPPRIYPTWAQSSSKPIAQKLGPPYLISTNSERLLQNSPPSAKNPRRQLRTV